MLFRSGRRKCGVAPARVLMVCRRATASPRRWRLTMEGESHGFPLAAVANQGRERRRRRGEDCGCSAGEDERLRERFGRPICGICGRDGSKPGRVARAFQLGPSFGGLAPSLARPASGIDRAGPLFLDRSELGPSPARLGPARFARDFFFCDLRERER